VRGTVRVLAAIASGLTIAVLGTAPANAHPAVASPAAAPAAACSGAACSQLHLTKTKLSKQSNSAAHLRQAAAADRARRTAAAAGRSAAPLAALTDECEQGVSNPTRFVSCSDDTWTLTHTRTVNGVTTVVGTLPFEVISSAEFTEAPTSNLVPDWHLTVGVFTSAGTGTLAAGTTGTILSTCGRNPAVCETAGSDAFPITMTPGGAVGFNWQQSDSGFVNTQPDAQDYLDNKIGAILDLNTPAGVREANDATAGTLWARCDSVFTPAACVDEYGPIYVAFDATVKPAVGPVADHIYTAQANLPSHWGNPVTGQPLLHAIDDAVETANRNAACPAGQTPAGQSCDEYPMASTYEGASLSAAGDWSIAYVPVAANSSQGGTLNTFYSEDRVVDLDAFYVLAVRANGSSSW